MKINKLKGKPPFYWLLIFMMIILLEYVVLIQERTWSQSYGGFISSLRDQVERLNIENQLIFVGLYKYYEKLINVQYFTEPQREYIPVKNFTYYLKIKNE